MADENSNAASNTVAERLLSLLALRNIPELDKALRGADPALSRDQLTFLRIGEENGQNRKGALLAIDEAAERHDRAERDAAAAEARREAEEAEARLAKFGRGIPLAEGADPVAAARTGPTFLVLGDGQREIAGLSRVAAKPEQFSVAGGRVMFGRPIRVGGADVKVAIRHVALLDEEGAVHAVCEIPGGLDLGGRDVELPGGSLVFG